jgi:hypothetical protein
MWFVTNEKLGGSAIGLQRLLGMGSYQTAWMWLHKLRRVMVRPGCDLLTGVVEQGVRGRETETKSIMVIAVELREPKGFGRVRLRRVHDLSGNSLVGFVREVIKPGAVVRTDGWKGYDSLPKHGYERQKINLAASESPAHVVVPAVHRVASLLQR